MSRQIGLKNFHVAEITTDDETGTVYGTPIKTERSISAKINPSTSSENIYSDDALEETVNTFDSIDVEFELNTLSLETRAKLQGCKLINGVLIESKEDIAPEVAIGFQSKKSNGEYRYVWLLKGKFQIPEDDYETIADKATSQTSTLKGTFAPRISDGQYRFIADSDSQGINKAILTAWFNKVPEQADFTAGTTTPVVASGLTITSIAGTNTGDTKITVTPAKASGNSYKYKSGASVTAPNVGTDTTTGYQTWDGTTDLTIATGQKILVVEVDAVGKVVKAGDTTVTAKV